VPGDSETPAARYAVSSEGSIGRSRGRLFARSRTSGEEQGPEAASVPVTGKEAHSQVTR